MHKVREATQQMGIKVRWIVSTTLSTAIGTWVGGLVFPKSGGSQVWEWNNPVHWDIFGFDVVVDCTGMCVRWDVIGFAILTGVSLGIGQYITLRSDLKKAGRAYKNLWLWMLVTATGAILAILYYSQWGTPFDVFFHKPGLYIFLMVPGVLFLGFAQGVLLFFILKPNYILPTIYLVATLLGACLAFAFMPVGLLLGLSLIPMIFPDNTGFQILVSVVIFTLLGISIVQGFVLEYALEPKGEQ